MKQGFGNRIRKGMMNGIVAAGILTGTAQAQEGTPDYTRIKVPEVILNGLGYTPQGPERVGIVQACKDLWLPLFGSAADTMKTAVSNSNWTIEEKQRFVQRAGRLKNILANISGEDKGLICLAYALTIKDQTGQFYSGSSNIDDPLLKFQEGASDYLSKEFNRNDLMEKVDEMVNLF